MLNSKAEHKAFIIGYPVAHSLSPKLHGFWLKQYGVDGSYEAINVPPEYLVKTVKKLPETFVGGNVTIPHKEKLLLLCDEVDPLAKQVGAVNTLVFEKGRIHGYNTDVFGFMENLRVSGVIPKNALVLGAGGAARAVILGLQRFGAKVTISNRTHEKAEKLAKEFNCGAIGWAAKDVILPDMDLVVNTTSLGIKGEGKIDIDFEELPKHAAVNDIVYNPLETDFLKNAKAAGLKTVDGLGMLLYQAVQGFEFWFGKRPEVTNELREHVLKCL